MSYQATINKHNLELLQAIEEYRNSPLDDINLEKLRRTFNSLNTSSYNVIQALEDKLILAEDKIKSSYQKSQEDKAKTLNKFEKNSALTKDKYIKLINNIKEENEKNIIDLKNQNEELYLDHELLLRSNDQRRVIIKKELEENLRKFEFQITNADISYEQAIETNNDKMRDKLSNEEQKYKTALVDFDREVINYIADIEKKVIEQNSQKDDFKSKLALVEKNKKQKILQESINLNKIIYSLTTDRNILIDRAKEKYQKSISESNVLRDNEQKELKLSSNNILKEFVKEFTRLDEDENLLKQEYNTIKSHEEFEHLLLVKKLQKREEKKLIELYRLKLASSKVINTSIKTIKKSTITEYNLLKKRHKKLIDELTIRYYKKIEEIKHQKQVLELKKNNDIQVISAKEQYINKYYQEHNTIYETTLNSEIDIANLKFNQKANQAKYQSDLKRIDIEKDFDISEANFKKKLEMIETEIKDLSYKVSSIRKLKNMLHNYEDVKFEKTSNYINVKYLLEIELNRILNDYNHKQYDSNITISRLNTNHSLHLLRIEENKSKAKLVLDEKRIKHLINKSTTLSGYEIFKKGILEDYERKINNEAMAFDNSIITHSLLYSRFKQELKEINFHCICLTSLYELIKQAFSRITPILLSIFKEDVNNVFLINNLNTRLANILSSFFKALMVDYNEAISEIIYRHNEFEEKIKFKTSYEGIIIRYENEKKKIQAKRQEINLSIEKNQENINSFTNRIYMLKNQEYYEKNQNKQNKKYIRSLSKNQKDLKNRILEMTKMNNMLYADIANLELKSKELEIDYNTKIERQTKLQHESAKTYYELKRGINSFTNKLNELFVYKPIILNLRKKLQYNHIIGKKSDKLYDIINLSNKVLYKQISNFILKTNAEFNRNNRRITSNHNENIKVIKKERMRALAENLQQIEETNNEFSTRLRWVDLELKNNEYVYSNNLTDYINKYNNNVNNLINTQKNNLKTFYLEFDLMTKNKEDLKKNYDSIIKATDLANINSKNSRNKRDMEYEINLKTSLDEFIKKKDELINHLPSAVKYKSSEFNRQLKELLSLDNTRLNETKVNLGLEIKRINRNTHQIKLDLDELLSESSMNYQKDLIKIKKQYNNKLKHLLAESN